MPGRSVRRPRAATTLVAAALPLALLAGCSEEIEPRFPDESESPSASASPSGPAEPTPPAAMKGSGEAAAKAFVRYYFEQLAYAQSTGDVGGLTGLAAKDCAACHGAVRSIRDAYEVGGRIAGGEFTVKRLRASSGKGPTAYEASAEVATTRQTVSGSRNQEANGTYPAGSQQMRFTLELTQQGWKMTEWSIS